MVLMWHLGFTFHHGELRGTDEHHSPEEEEVGIELGLGKGKILISVMMEFTFEVWSCWEWPENLEPGTQKGGANEAG